MDDLKQDHIDTVNRLMVLTLEGDSHEMLSAICRAIVPGTQSFGWTHGACEVLRDRLIRLICYTADDARLYYEEGFDAGFASADDWLAQHEDAMAEHGWYRSLCADRKPMLLGDRMEWANGTFTIRELKFTEGGCTTWDSEHGYTVNADECRHHHAPTVEDVMVEFLDRMEELGTIDQCVGADRAEAVDALLRERAELVAEFAAKLRLAEEDV